MTAIIRIAIGLLFVISGFMKVTAPYQNFKYIIEAYALLPGWGEMAVATVLPWIELLTGLFLVLGLWGRLAVKSAMVMFAVFVVVVGQALLRGLPLDQCGCFGELLHISPRVTIVMDSIFLLLCVYLLTRPNALRPLSLDKYLEKIEEK